MTTPKISFVVLSYNYARYIGECIASILDQAGDHDFEVIVVDDASTDDSEAVIRSFEDARIIYVRHPQNLGHAATVTDGLKIARGNLVARIDSDDRYRPEFLNEVVPLFDRFPDVGLVYGDAAIINEHGSITQVGVDVVHGGRDYHGSEYVKLLRQNFICAPTVIARREAWLQALPIPEWLVFHDWFFTLMIARHYPFYFRAAILADYRVHPHNYHSLIARNKTEEPSIIGLLDRLFGTPESDAELQDEKEQARSAVYSTHYLTFAQKYFWFDLNADARRCYWRAIRMNPSLLGRPDVARQFAATLVSRRLYDGVKKFVKRG